MFRCPEEEPGARRMLPAVSKLVKCARNLILKARTYNTLRRAGERREEVRSGLAWRAIEAHPGEKSFAALQGSQ